MSAEITNADCVDANKYFKRRGSVKLIKKDAETFLEERYFVDDFQYKMDYLNRGLALIINNKNFDSETGLSVRFGTDKDAANLENTLSYLHFSVQIYNDLRALEILELLEKVSSYDHSDSDCFFCAILSHGEDGVIYGKDKALEIQAITSLFKTSKTLLGKPKIFVFQACRGEKLMEGIGKMATDSISKSFVPRIPVEADFLLVYSTVPGFYSWRNSVEGSWFIQAFCKALNKYGDDWDILRILTVVNRRVAFDYESNTTDPRMSCKKQIPCIVSMLTKELYFRRKMD